MNLSSTVRETILKHDQGSIVVTEVSPGRRKISVEIYDPELFTPLSRCETSYPIDLIQQILEAKGPAWLCDEIARDESPEYVEHNIRWNVLIYVPEEDFKHKRVLDFGCGSGASTAVLSRMFPDTEILGIELEEKFLSIAKSRAKFYGLDNVGFDVSPNPDSLPNNIGKFDYVMLSAVYEHLLPQERKILLPLLWSVLKPGGLLFLGETPYRYYPVETHTTSGLWLINYLPDKWALFYARKYSRRNLGQDDWQTLLRKGIRGGCISEILSILGEASSKPTLLSPSMNGAKDRIDIWWLMTNKGRYSVAKKVFRISAKALKAVSGIEFLPELRLAIRKDSGAW